MTNNHDHTSLQKQSWYRHLYPQVLLAILIGILLGHFYPEWGVAMKPFSDAFIRIIKFLISPIVFCTVVLGIAGMKDMKTVGKTGGVCTTVF